MRGLPSFYLYIGKLGGNAPAASFEKEIGIPVWVTHHTLIEFIRPFVDFLFQQRT